MKSVMNQASAMPTATPESAIAIPWRITSPITCRASAPNAMRIPISCVRRLAVYESTP